MTSGAPAARTWRYFLTAGELEELRGIERERAEIRDRKRALRKEHYNLIWAGRDRARREEKNA